MGRSLAGPVKSLVAFEQDGERVFTIERYYDDFIHPLEKKFTKYSLRSNRTVICPLHDDNDPSMGTITSKEGQEIFHCFGCSRRGTVVDLHIHIEKKYKSRNIDEKSAVEELAAMFGVDPALLDSLEELTSLDQLMRNKVQRMEAIQGKSKDFNINDYRRGLREHRGDIRAINGLMVQMLIENARVEA